MNLDRVRNLVQQYLITKTDFLSVKDELDEDQLRIQTRNAIDFVCAKNEIVITDEEKGILIVK